jgi:ubiquinone/menaquinone biosynthesis C-methylase UbiE
VVLGTLSKKVSIGLVFPFIAVLPELRRRSHEMSKPHFVRDSNRLVRNLIAKESDYETAMARAVGGSYTVVGAQERRLLELLGLQGAHYVIDIGAGSGRLATALKDLPNLKYLGTDVVPELLEFARKKCGREDWMFKQVEKIEIPEQDEVADFVVFFSVFTHLREKESYRYLQEAKRVLRKSGTIVVSYLDPDVALHAQLIGKSWTQPKWWMRHVARLVGRGELAKFLSKKVLEKWSNELNMSIQYVDVHGEWQSVCAYRLA